MFNAQATPKWQLRPLKTLAIGLITALCGCSANDVDSSGETAAKQTFSAVTPVYSDLWGQAGERWSPQSRLPDFSFAGYRTGTVALPTPAIVSNVKSYGAVGDGIADDSQAFLNAIAATSSGAISIPAGRYKITKVLKITKSNLVLRGAGVGVTTLYFPNSLTDILGSGPVWAGNNGAWSWAGGFVWIEGDDTGAKLADVTGTALRGDKSLTVNSTAGISVGSTVRLVQLNNDGSLGRYLHVEQGSAGSFAPSKLVDFAVKVVGISGSTLTLERPLRTDVRAAWTPQIYAFSPTVRDTGIEDLAIEFPNTSYPPHLSERGYNGIYLDGVSDCFIKNVTFWDADSGIVSATQTNRISRFCTIDNVRLANRWRPASGITGHHGIALEGPQDMLITRFNFEKQFLHDLTVDTASTGNVFSAGRGANMNFDHHRCVPYENLFTDIDVGPGDTLWLGSRNQESGSGDCGPVTGARETVWNVRASNAPAGLPNWPQFNVIGMTRYPTQKTGNLWVEQIDPAALTPANLHLAQLAVRQAGGPTQPVLTSITVSPGSAALNASSSQQFTAAARDQSGNLMNPQPTFIWAATGGSVTSSGLYTAGATAGNYTVTASAAGKSGTSTVTIATTPNPGGSTTLITNADAYVRDGAVAATNFGAETVLELKNHDIGWRRQGYLRFDLSAVAGTITTAKLRLYGKLGGSDPLLSIGAFALASPSNWSEAGLTWNNQPAVAGAPLSSVNVVGSTASWYEWDVTSYVRAEKDAGRTSVSLAIKAITVSATLGEFASKETGATAPQLVVSLDGGSPPVNQGPTVVQAGAASPSTVTGLTTSLGTLGADDGGEANLRYTWSTTGSPPAAVTFSANGTNAAKQSTATFSKAGNYAFRVTITDAQAATTTSNVSVTVAQTKTLVAIQPRNVTIAAGGTAQFAATVQDQFGASILPAPPVTWSASGGGTISSSGLYSAGAAGGGPFVVSATSSPVSGSANVTITSGSSSSVALGPIADSFVRDANYGSTNYGALSTLEVKNHDLSWSRVSLFLFDTNTVPNVVTSAKLRLYGALSASESLTLRTFGIGTNWLESSITWNNQPTATANFLSELTLTSTAQQWYEWDVTSYVKSERAAGRTQIGLQLRSMTYSATLGIFTTKEAGANAPQLLITSG